MPEESTVDFDVNDLEGVEEVDENIDNDVPMDYTHPEWTDYVLTLFTENELAAPNRPRVDGLRRVTEDVIGPILSTRSDVLQVPNTENERRATVKVSLAIDYGDCVREIDGVADVYWGNTDKPYRNHPVATAETRAEARALRRALRLSSNVVAHEEIGGVADHDYSETEQREKGLITPQQIKFLGVMCSRINVNVEKFVKKFHSVDKITELTHADSLELQKTLSEYQQDADAIPEEIIEYNDNWEANFSGD
jgi:hypothetical protein